MAARAAAKKFTPFHALYCRTLLFDSRECGGNRLFWRSRRAVFSIQKELAVMWCIYNRDAVFDWDENNLRKIRTHRIKPEEVEQGLANSPIPIYEQDVQGELRYVYYCEADSGRLLAVIVAERGEQIRVVTAYVLDAGQKRDYLARRLRGE